jgi:DNA-binding transcriptional LysR family regulator
LYFIAIAENPSISAAAKKLGISQPPLSAQLQLLEKEFGVRLTERGPKGVSLTEAGRMLYKRAVSIVALSDAAIKDLKDYSSGLRGTLRLGTGSSCGMALLGGRLAAFSEAYPLISFEIHEGAAFAMLDLLAANVIDVAVVRTPFQTESYHCEFLAPEPMVAAATEKFFPSPSPDVISLSELEGLPLVYYRRMEHVIMAAFEKAAVEPYAYCINDDARTCLMWARAGLGVAVVPQSIFPVFADPGLRSRAINSPDLVTQIAAIRPKDRDCSPAAEAFLQIFSSQA